MDEKIEFNSAFESSPALSQLQAHMNPRQNTFTDWEVQKLLSKQVTSLCEHDTGEVISPILTRPKKDGWYRMTEFKTA